MGFCFRAGLDRCRDPEFRTGPTVRNSESDPNLSHCVGIESENRFHVAHRHHELDGHFGVKSPSTNSRDRPGPTNPSQNSDLPTNSDTEYRNLDPDHYRGREKGAMVTKGMLQTYSVVRYTPLVHQNVLSSTVCGTVELVSLLCSVCKSVFFFRKSA